jgi:uncharacterized protein YggE
MRIEGLGGREGVTVLGSAVLRVPPDMAAVVVAVTRVEQKPDAAFTKAREAAQSVTAYLHRAGVQDFGSSRAALANEFRQTGGERKFVGYQAMIEFNVMLRDMDRVDAVLTGLLAAGANVLRSVTFQTSRLKEVRAEARRRAVLAAREKAELYCAAAGVAVGAVVSIEDVDPQQLSGRWEGHTFREPELGDGDEPGAMEPGAIAVSAAVSVRYRIARRSPD